MINRLNTNPYPTIEPSDLHLYGKVKCTHGHQGKLVVALASPEYAELNPLFLFLIVDEIPIPFRVESVRGQADQLILKLKSIDRLSSAKDYMGCQLMILQEELPEKYTSYEKELCGYTLVHPEAEEIGKVVDLDTTTSNTLLLVEMTGDQKTVVIPLVEEWLQAIDFQNKTITLSFPLQLLTL